MGFVESCRVHPPVSGTATSRALGCPRPLVSLADRPLTRRWLQTGPESSKLATFRRFFFGHSSVRRLRTKLATSL